MTANSSSARSAVTVSQALQRAVVGVSGEHRPGQLAMAEAVAHTLAGERTLLVQAGTGTGKSLAYLTPAILYALGQSEHTTRSGPVIIATATLALQRQLVERDLPVARHLPCSKAATTTCARTNSIGMHLRMTAMRHSSRRLAAHSVGKPRPSVSGPTARQRGTETS